MLNSVGNAWEKLSLFESRDLVTQAFFKRHQREINAEKAKEIISYLAQGREYFRSAAHAADLVKPLLLYYGVLSLSRSLILYLKPRARDSSIKKAHGLRDVSWGQTLSRSIRNLPDTLIRFEGGTFFELSEVTRNRERIVFYGGSFAEPAILVTEGGPSPILVGTEWSLKELLARLPDLQPTYERTFSEHGSSFPCQFVINYPNGRMVATINILPTDLGLPDEEHLRSSLRLPSTISLTRSTSAVGRTDRIDCLSLVFEIESKEDKAKLAEILPPLKSDRNENTFITAPADTEKALSNLCLLYVVSYALGMLVRYYPSQWLSLLNRSSGDHTFPILKASISVIEQRFPELLALEFEDSFEPGYVYGI